MRRKVRCPGKTRSPAAERDASPAGAVRCSRPGTQAGAQRSRVSSCVAAAAPRVHDCRRGGLCASGSRREVRSRWGSRVRGSEPGRAHPCCEGRRVRLSWSHVAPVQRRGDPRRSSVYAVLCDGTRCARGGEGRWELQRRRSGICALIRFESSFACSWIWSAVFQRWRAQLRARAPRCW